LFKSIYVGRKVDSGPAICKEEYNEKTMPNEKEQKKGEKRRGKYNMRWEDSCIAWLSEQQQQQRAIGRSKPHIP
jgi:hypothetical protein